MPAAGPVLVRIVAAAVLAVSELTVAAVTPVVVPGIAPPIEYLTELANPPATVVVVGRARAPLVLCAVIVKPELHVACGSEMVADQFCCCKPPVTVKFVMSTLPPFPPAFGVTVTLTPVNAGVVVEGGEPAPVAPVLSRMQL